MIPETDRYHGVVLRQIVRGATRPLKIAVADLAGRVDAFQIDGGAIHIKHSSKRLSPWQFTYFDENVNELRELQSRFSPVWEMLVCGIDGIVCLSAEDLLPLITAEPGRASSIRVRRSRNAMYRISAQGETLPRAFRRGVGEFLEAVGSNAPEAAK